MAIARTLRKTIIELLITIPSLGTEEGRKAALYSAGLEQILPDLNLRGNSRETITLIVEHLENMGKLPDDQFGLVQFLEELQNLVGREKQIKLQELCTQLPNQLPVAPRSLRSKHQRQAEDRNRENLLILLQRVQEAWIEGVFKQSLHSEVLIELGKTSQDGAVDKLDQPLNLMLQSTEATEQTPILQDDIREIYENAQQTLLILGAPGAGKTMTLLDLTRQLVDDAANDPNQAIPVVFNLSSWTDKRQTIADWLVDELLTKYRIPKKIGRTWIDNVENRPLVYMLDGLDEVVDDLQLDCVEAINDFREKYALSGIVVACREKEYGEITTRLKLEQALCVQPLTNQQITDYLSSAGADLLGLRTALPKDEALQELARSPLMLSIMSLTYQNQSSETICQDIGKTSATRQHRLFATYVQHMFQRPRPHVWYGETKTRRWLAFLASNMQKHGQTIFQLENIQPSWLKKIELLFYDMCSLICIGMAWGGGLDLVISTFWGWGSGDFLVIMFLTGIATVTFSFCEGVRLFVGTNNKIFSLILYIFATDWLGIVLALSAPKESTIEIIEIICMTNFFLIFLGLVFGLRMLKRTSIGEIYSSPA